MKLRWNPGEIPTKLWQRVLKHRKTTRKLGLPNTVPQGGSGKGDPTKQILKHHLLVIFKSLKRDLFSRIPLFESPLGGRWNIYCAAWLWLQQGSGTTTCLTLLVQDMFSSNVANKVANYGDPWHHGKHTTDEAVQCITSTLTWHSPKRPPFARSYYDIICWATLTTLKLCPAEYADICWSHVKLCVVWTLVRNVMCHIRQVALGK